MIIMETRKKKINDLPSFSKSLVAFEKLYNGGLFIHGSVPYCYFKGRNAEDENDNDFLCYEDVDGNYAIIRFEYIDGGLLNLDCPTEYDCFNYDEDGDGIAEEIGFFIIEDSSYTCRNDKIHFVASFPEEMIEVICIKYNLSSQAIKAKSPSEAFFNYIKSV